MHSYTVSKEVLAKIEKDYKKYIINKDLGDLGYIKFVAKTNDVIITGYDNKKGVNFKVTFQGPQEIEIAKKYVNPLQIPKKNKKTKESLYYIDVDDQIGSDEVGTGDFLAPIVVCAAYCNHDAMQLIEKYDIKDSKKLTDSRLLEIVPLILNKVHYEVKVLSNQRYNFAISKGFNMVSIKAILHNSVLTKLHQKCPYVQNLYVDQFTTPKAYFDALKDIENKTENIVFKEKGETYFPSVALASCIARYTFIKEVNNISKNLGEQIPLGAGKKVDEFAISFAKKHGIEKLESICKSNFKNFKEIKNKLK